MKIRNLEENSKQIKLMYKQISDNEKLIAEITDKLKSDEAEETVDASELLNQLKVAKADIKRLNDNISQLTNGITNLPSAIFNREMIGNEVAKLISEIMGKKYIYKEDYCYRIENCSDYRFECRHVTTLKEKIYTIIDEDYINHEPYIECYDKEFLDLSDNNYEYWHHKRGYINPYQDLIDRKILFILPGPHLLQYDKKQQEYIKQGNMNYKINIDKEKSYILGLYDSNKIIEDFLLIVILKSFDMDRSLSQEEIEQIRIKFIELYNLGYDFEYYEDVLDKMNETNKQKIISPNNN